MEDFKPAPTCVIRFASIGDFSEFMSTLHPNDQDLVMTAIESILRPYGKALIDEGWLKDLGGELFEFRVGPTRRKIRRRTNQNLHNFFDADLLVRIFCLFDAETEIVILHSYDKTIDRSRSTQKSEISIARELLLKTRSSLEF